MLILADSSWGGKRTLATIDGDLDRHAVGRKLLAGEAGGRGVGARARHGVRVCMSPEARKRLGSVDGRVVDKKLARSSTGLVTDDRSEKQCGVTTRRRAQRL